MNAPHPLQNQLLAAAQSAPSEGEDGVRLLEYWDIVVDHKWLVVAALATALALSAAYSLVASPVFEANTLIQVEDNAGGSKLLGEAASLFDVKTATTAEIEILRSRLIIGAAVENTKQYIQARPRYIPFIGRALARRADGLVGAWLPGAVRVRAWNREHHGSPFRCSSKARRHAFSLDCQRSKTPTS
jgi:tyrosine-protein kinase Etk/Wzc